MQRKDAVPPSLFSLSLSRFRPYSLFSFSSLLYPFLFPSVSISLPFSFPFYSLLFPFLLSSFYSPLPTRFFFISFFLFVTTLTMRNMTRELIFRNRYLSPFFLSLSLTHLWSGSYASAIVLKSYWVAPFTHSTPALCSYNSDEKIMVYWQVIVLKMVYMNTLKWENIRAM